MDYRSEKYSIIIFLIQVTDRELPTVNYLSFLTKRFFIKNILLYDKSTATIKL
jgi:hypothetical protein